jgi:hypothetical protein
VCVGYACSQCRTRAHQPPTPAQRHARALESHVANLAIGTWVIRSCVALCAGCPHNMGLGPIFCTPTHPACMPPTLPPITRRLCAAMHPPRCPTPPTHCPHTSEPPTTTAPPPHTTVLGRTQAPPPPLSPPHPFTPPISHTHQPCS